MDDKVRYQARRMYEVADGYFETSERLSASEYGIDTLTAAESSTMLGILSFEIFLKCAIVIQNGLEIVRGHDYCILFQALTPELRADIISAASERCSLDAKANLNGKFENVLKDIKDAFTKGRYPYEACFDYSYQQVKEKENNWQNRGTSIAGADYRYRPEETNALAWALKKHIEEQLGICEHPLQKCP